MSPDCCEIILHRMDGGPALTVALPDPGWPGRVLGVTLAEGGGGRPMGYVVQGDPEDLERRPRGMPTSLGVRFAAHWVDGHAVDDEMGRESFGMDVPAGVRGRAASLAAGAIRSAGFSAAFVDMLECMRDWHPLKVSESQFHQFCGDGPHAAALRDFVRDHPVLATAHAASLAHHASNGYEPDIAGAMLPEAKMRVISTAAWAPKARGPDAPGRASGTRGFEDVTMGRLLEVVPVEWLPRDGDGVAAFTEAACMLSVAGPLNLDLATLAAPSRGRWKTFVDRCRAAGPGLEWMPVHPHEVPHLNDPAMHLAHRVLIPIMAGTGAPRNDIDAMVELKHVSWKAALQLLYGGKGLPSVVRTCERWHAVLPSIERALPSDADADGNEWPALLPPAEFGGIALACLTTGKALRDEGARGEDADGVAGLDHCVGSYRSRASAGQCHIVGLRRASEGTRLATAEVRQSRTGRVDVVQLRGGGNREPPEGCAEALAAYLAGPVPYLPPRPMQGDAVRLACGYDWRDDSLVLQAVAAYASFLPRGLRGGIEPLAGWLRDRNGRPASECLRP